MVQFFNFTDNIYKQRINEDWCIRFVFCCIMITSSKWKHFPRYWPFVWGIHRSPVNSPRKGQWRRALMFSFICAWINNWVNNHEAGDLRCHRPHYDITVMILSWAGANQFNPYPSCLIHSQWRNHHIAPVPVKQPWKKWVNVSHWWSARTADMTTTKQSVTELYTVLSCFALLWVYLQNCTCIFYHTHQRHPILTMCVLCNSQWIPISANCILMSGCPQGPFMMHKWVLMPCVLN